MPALRSATLAFALIAGPVLADPPVIESASLDGNRLSVSLSHPDTGWDHYANGWQVHSPDGTLIGTRPLAHPHVDEQPFTRSVTLDDWPPEIDHFIITAICTNGDTSAPFQFELPD